MPKISVLMPVYKTPEAYLKAAIESILAQTFGDFEFLILDDCPQDDRQKIVESYGDKRIKYIKNPQNMGISAARNKLIDLAKGEYLAVFDHDDISLPPRFEKEAAYLDANPECGVVSSAQKLLVDGHVCIFPENDEDIKNQLFVRCCVVHSAAMIRKSVLTDNNIRYESEFSPAEDYALWCRLMSKTQFHNLPEVLFHYRNFAGNTSHLQKQKMADKTVQVQEFVRRENAKRWNRLLPYVKYVSRVKFLGVSVLKIVRRGNEAKGLLFGFLPLYKTKTKEVLKLPKK